MLTFHLGPLSRRARMFLQLVAGCVGMCALVGPALLSLANAPPIAAATSRTPLRLLAVKPFRDLSADGCSPYPPVHAGPTAVQGTVVGQLQLEKRLAAAVLECTADDWTGDLTISATVDVRGGITDVRLQGDASTHMQGCLRTNVLRGHPLATRGPGTLHASYFMGRRT
jgi:hypothetical protein